MAKKNTSTPRQYGRQAQGKTIKSISLESDVAEFIEKEAAKKGISVSAFVNEFLKGTMKLLLFLACCSALFRWVSGNDPVTAAFMGVADAATVAGHAIYFTGCCGVEIARAIFA